MMHSVSCMHLFVTVPRSGLKHAWYVFCSSILFKDSLKSIFALKVESIYLCTDGTCLGNENDKLRRKVSIMYGLNASTESQLSMCIQLCIHLEFRNFDPC